MDYRKAYWFEQPHMPGMFNVAVQPIVDPRDGRLHFVVPEVHPRSRGEYYDDGVCDICNGGSSPLTRGIPSAINDWEIANGFIPAHAGNTIRMVHKC